MFRLPTISLIAAGLLAMLSVAAQAFDTRAPHAVLMDFETGQILYAKNADEPMPPASMSKLMTMLMMFEALDENRVALDDTFFVSENAWRKGGWASGSSTMSLKPNSEAPVEALIRGVIVQSGNDASIVIAEGLKGTEEAFAEAMNERAKEIGLENSTFRNATGWPDPEHKMSAMDLAKLARHIIENHPEKYKYYAETSFEWNGITQGNRNPLLYMNIGADGLKTGHTEDSGYGLVSSAKRDDQRLIAVVNGLDSKRARAEESRKLLEWGFREFRTYDLAGRGQVLERAPVWQGSYFRVPLVAGTDVKLLMSSSQRKNMTARVVYETPVQAPVEAGQAVGKLVIEAPDMPTREFPLVAGADVERLGLPGRAWFAIDYMIFGET